MRSDDEKWFDALAGHQAPASADDARMQSAVREAASRIEPAQGEVDMLAQRRLLQRLEREGLLPSSPRPRWRPVRLAQAAVIVLCVGLVVELIRLEPLPRFVREAEAPMPARPSAHAERAPKVAADQAQSLAKADAFNEPAEAAASAPQSAPMPSGSRDQAVGLAVPGERRQAMARAAPPGDISVVVAEPAQAWRELQEWLAANTGVTVISGDESAYRISLRCDEQSSCQDLRDWLHAIDQSLPTPRMGQVLSLRLESSS